MNEQEPYRFRAKIGDFVRLPSGVTGTIIASDFFCGGNSRGIKVRPDNRASMTLGQRVAGGVWFYDGAIDRLELICTKEELECIGV